MTDDQTILLIKEAMINAGLDEAEAQRVANNAQANTEAMVRFEAIEEELTQIANVHKRIKKVGSIIGLLLLTNFVGDIYEWLQVIGTK